RLGGVVADVVEVDQGIVLLHVRVGVANEAGTGHGLLVALPTPPRRLDPVHRDVRLGLEAVRTVVADAERRRAGQGEVVGKARVRDCRVVRGQAVARGEVVDVRRLRRVPYDLAV